MSMVRPVAPAAPLAPFANHLPVDVRFGDGVLATLPAALADVGAYRPFIVLDPAVAELAAVRSALAALDPEHRLLVLDGREPTPATVDDAGARLASGADAVVAIGGGSTLDTAKGARLVASQGGPIARYTWPGEPEAIVRPAIPLVTVPTTAGTGSEVTGGVVLHDPDRGIKIAAPSPHNRAQVALVDPELTHGLPPGPTLYGGIDVVAQAIGAVVATTHTPIGDAIALEALRLARDALPAVVDDGADTAARSRMACASLMAGLAMNLSEASSDHSLAHALGARHGLPHGLAVGLVLAEAMEHDRPARPDAFGRVADALGAPPEGAVPAVRDLLARINFPTLTQCGVAEADLGPLADAALTAWIPVSPAPWTREDAYRAFRRALDLVTRAGSPASGRSADARTVMSAATTDPSRR
jgi:choline dehydrogenase